MGFESAEIRTDGINQGACISIQSVDIASPIESAGIVCQVVEHEVLQDWDGESVRKHVLLEHPL